MPFLRIKTSRGVAVAVFYRRRARWRASRRPRCGPEPTCPPSLPPRCAGDARQTEPDHVREPGCSTGDVSLPPESLLKLASGAAFNPPPFHSKNAERLRLDKVDPADYPTALVQAVFEYCRQHGQFRAVWLFTRTMAGQPAAARKAYYVLVLMEPRDEALLHDFLLVGQVREQGI